MGNETEKLPVAILRTESPNKVYLNNECKLISAEQSQLKSGLLKDFTPLFYSISKKIRFSFHPQNPGQSWWQWRTQLIQSSVSADNTFTKKDNVQTDLMLRSRNIRL